MLVTCWLTGKFQDFPEPSTLISRTFQALEILGKNPGLSRKHGNPDYETMDIEHATSIVHWYSLHQPKDGQAELTWVAGPMKLPHSVRFTLPCQHQPGLTISKLTCCHHQAKPLPSVQLSAKD